METDSRLDNLKGGLRWMWNDSKIFSLLFPSIVGLIIYSIVVTEELSYQIFYTLVLLVFIGVMTLIIINAGKQYKIREQIRQSFASIDDNLDALTQLSLYISAEAQQLIDRENSIVSNMGGVTQSFLHLSAELERLNNELENPQHEEDTPDEDF